jgi:hypothetical protein
MAGLTNQLRSGDRHDVPTTPHVPDGVILCPDPTCLAPARIIERFWLDSTDGPVEHAKTKCPIGHRLTPRVESL